MNSFKILNSTLFAGLAFSLLSASSAAQIVDPAVEMNRMLSMVPAVVKQRSIQYQEYEYFCDHDGKPGKCAKIKGDVKTRIETFQEPPRAVTADIKSVSELTIDKARVVTLPSNYRVFTKEFRNCSKSPAQQNVSERVDVSFRNSVSMTRGVSSKIGVSAKLNFGAKAVGGSVGVDFSETVSVSQTEAYSRDYSLSRGWSETLTISPMAYSKATFQVVDVTVEAPFSATVEIDGAVDDNVDGKKSISDFLSVADRTIKIEGVLRANGVSNGETRRFERAMTPKECDTSTNLQVRDTITSYSSLVKSTIANLPLQGAANKSKTSIASTTANVAPAKLKRSGATLTNRLLGLLAKGEPGGWCYTGPCNEPLDGTRPVCYFDESGACSQCSDEPDSVCESPESKRKGR